MGLEQRTLILAPTGNDARLTSNFLAQSELSPHVCFELPQLCEEIDKGCGAVVLAEEAIGDSSISELIKTLGAQPSWSDLPIILITSGGEISQMHLRRLGIFGPGGNVMVLERPFRPDTLVSMVEAALRSRRRQYEARDRMEELKRAYEEIQKISRAKDDFLAALSHELRGPLNPVLLVSSEAANDRELSPGVRANFDMIRRNVELEARLIDDLLDLTRIAAGKLKFEKRHVNVHATLKSAIALVQSEIDQKRIILKQNLAAFQTIISGDNVRLQQIFSNVLKNAVKFTPMEGTITVETNSTGRELSISISDTGIGMTADELHHSFEIFTQGEHAKNPHHFGGLGLGLAICKKLTELHGGKIEAGSKGRNHGTTIAMRFPLAAWDEPMKKENSPFVSKQRAQSKTGVRILLVEDHEPTRTTLAALLTRRHHKVKMAICVSEALALAAKNDFDLVISDIGLPDGNGFDLFKKLRKQSSLKGIALTGYGMDEDIARSDDAGFMTHLTKPVHIESLDRALTLAMKD